MEKVTESMDSDKTKMGKHSGKGLIHTEWFVSADSFQKIISHSPILGLLGL